MGDIVVNAGGTLWVFLSTANIAAPSVSSYPNGNTVFLGFEALEVLAGETASSVTLRDFNGDGKLDAVIGSNGFGGNVSYPNQINVLAGDGTGSFTTPSVFPISTSPVRDIQILVGDFTYDAKLDVLAYSSPSSGGPTITLLPGNGAGVLGSGTALNPFGTGNARFYLAVSRGIPVAADFLSDGSDEPVLTGRNSNPSVTVLQTASAAGLLLSNVTLPGHGPQVLTASYPGDSNYAASTSNPITLETRAPVTVSLIDASSSSPSAFAGYPVTITASVAVPQGGVAPTGSIQFYSGSTALGSPVPLIGTMASYALSFPNLGVQYLTATYSGDSNYRPLTSPVLTITVVNQAAPTLSLTAASEFQTYGVPVAITVTMQTIPGPAPTGSVSLTFDGNPVGQDTLSGTPPFTLPFTWNPPTHPSIGYHTVTATYLSGDAS